MAVTCRRSTLFRPLRLALFAFLAVAAWPSAPAIAAEWHFAVPPGWVDLSPGQPLPAELPAEVTAAVHSGLYKAFAMDLHPANGGFKENLTAVVNPRALVADEGLLRKYVELLPAQAGREIPGANAGVLEQGIVSIQGVPSLRLVVAVIREDGSKLRMLQYIIPGGETSAALTYTSTAAAFPEHLPIFEAAARATQGAMPAPALARLRQRLLESWLGDLSPDDREKIFGGGGKLVGFVVAITLVTLVQRRIKRRKQGTGP